MSTLVQTTDASITAPVLAGTFPVPLPNIQPRGSLIITVPDFHCKFSASLTDITDIIDSTTVIVRAILDKHVNLTLTLTGRLAEGGAVFQVNQTSVQIKPAEELARADFVALTLNALLALARGVTLEIPDIGLDLKYLNFDLSLLEGSRLLQTRQTAYRLMVIERATGIQFVLPMHFSSDEMTRILFAYRAIVDRSFNWPFEVYRLPVWANQETLARLITMKQSSQITFRLPPENDTILGKSIHLGDVKVTVEDGCIDNFDKVKKELETFDNHQSEVVIRSLNGQAKFELPNAPRLPASPWDSNIQGLIDLESPLDARLVERYHALAAATLEGLTEEEKAAVTARVELDEEAFAIEDWNKEDS